jgi:uncharacterized membrane protein YkoI
MLQAMKFPISVVAAMCAVIVLVPGVAVGDDDDHDRLRDALARDELVSFRSIFDWIEQRYDGRIVEVELEDDDDALIYEVDLLTPRGEKVEFEFDARSGALMSIKGRAVPAAKPQR